MKKKAPFKYTTHLGFFYLDINHKIMNVLAIVVILTAIVAFVMITTELI